MRTRKRFIIDSVACVLIVGLFISILCHLFFLNPYVMGESISKQQINTILADSTSFWSGGGEMPDSHYIRFTDNEIAHKIDCSSCYYSFKKNNEIEIKVFIEEKRYKNESFKYRSFECPHRRIIYEEN